MISSPKSWYNKKPTPIRRLVETVLELPAHTYGLFFSRTSYEGGGRKIDLVWLLDRIRRRDRTHTRSIVIG